MKNQNKWIKVIIILFILILVLICNKETVIKFLSSIYSGFIRTVIDEMTDHFAETDIISIPSFGTFEVKKRLERIVVNPATKKRMLVPPKLVLCFKPVQSIKEQLKNASFEDEEGGLDE